MTCKFFKISSESINIATDL